MFGRRRRRDPADGGPPEDVYLDLRAMALDAVAAGLAAPDPAHPTVSGLVVDIPGEGGCASVVALTDGTTSMYTSSGGGVIGAGGHAAVAEATRALLTVADAHAGLVRDPAETQLPGPGVVRFHLLTPSGRRCVDVPEGAFWGEEPHPLMPVIAATQQVISELRRASPS